MDLSLAGAPGSPQAVLLDALASNLDVGLLLLSSGGDLEFANRRAAELLGCDPDHLQGKWPALKTQLQLQAVRPDSPAGVLRSTAALDLGGEIRHLRLEVRALSTAAGAGSMVLLKDRRMLGFIDAELLCASRLRAWEHRCEVVLHDLNGALNTMQLTLELLDGQWDGQWPVRPPEAARDPKYRSHVTVLKDTLERFKATLKRLPPGQTSSAPPKTGEFDLRDVLRDTGSALKLPARRRSVDFQVVAGDTPLLLMARRDWVAQAVLDITFARLTAVPERGRLALSAVRGERAIEIEIRDSGPAPGEVQQGRVFDVLFVKGEGGDAVRLARTLVECEGGELQVTGGAGEDTVFRMRFPTLH